MKSGISACIIGKDEEKNLNRCLNSVKNVVDEIIYLDTGSIDKSIAIAKSFGAKVYSCSFENDFSKARNKCISYATFNWILVIDCDEEVDIDSRDAIKDIVKLDIFEGIVVNIINVVSGEKVDRFQFPRIFRNGRGYYFTGKIHEQIAPNIVKRSGLASLKNMDINIYHYGYNLDNATENKKHLRNLDILNSVNEEEKNDYYYFNLGNEYGRVNNIEKAIEAYEKALNLMNQIETYNVLLYERLGHFYYLQGKFQKTINICKEGKMLFSKHMYYYYAMGLSYIEQMKFSSALEELNSAKKLFEATKKNPKFVPLGLGIVSKETMYEAIDELKDCIIKSCTNTITTIIDCRNEKKISEETIKSINEISKEIIVITNSLDIVEVDDYVDYKKINLNNRLKSREANYSIIEIIRNNIKIINTQYILLLKNNEGLTFEDQEKVYKKIDSKDRGYYYLYSIRFNKSEVRFVKKEYIDKLNKSKEGKYSNIDISYFI